MTSGFAALSSQLSSHDFKEEEVSVEDDLEFNELDEYKNACAGVTLYHGRTSDHVVDYNPAVVSSFGVFCMGKGSVFQSKLLWAEELAVLIIFGFSCLFFYQLQDIWTAEGHAMEVLETFSSKLFLLATFLLGFYTSLSVGRWWRLRTNGVGNIWSAASQLSLLISQFGTRDPQILSAIRRYARASLAMVFLKRRYGDRFPEKLGALTTLEILTEHEVSQLEKWNNNLAESIWTWNMAIVRGLGQTGAIPNCMVRRMVDVVLLGRSGAALIGAQMGTPIPYTYVHIIGFMVKIWNVVLAISKGLVASEAYATGHGLEVITAFMKVLLMTLFYNSTLIMNQKLADPFGADLTDFPCEKYELGIEGDGKSYVNAGENLPVWLRQKMVEKSSLVH